jgi:hypothetical protein
VQWAGALCSVPDGETTVPASPPYDPNNAISAASFTVTVTGGNFNGRMIRETEPTGDGATDTCYEYIYGATPAYPIPTTSGATLPTSGNPSNSYGDYVGYLSTFVSQLWEYVPYQGFPCGFTVYQTMQMWCGEPLEWQTYYTDTHTAAVWYEYVEDCRDGVCVDLAP